jgi:hypothetical protein
MASEINQEFMDQAEKWAVALVEKLSANKENKENSIVDCDEQEQKAVEELQEWDMLDPFVPEIVKKQLVKMRYEFLKAEANRPKSKWEFVMGKMNKKK